MWCDPMRCNVMSQGPNEKHFDDVDILNKNYYYYFIKEIEIMLCVYGRIRKYFEPSNTAQILPNFISYLHQAMQRLADIFYFLKKLVYIPTLECYKRINIHNLIPSHLILNHSTLWFNIWRIQIYMASTNL